MTAAEDVRRRFAEGHTRTLDLPNRDPRIIEPMPFAPAAVLVAITDRPEPGVILTRRASHMRKHAGQVAFPGGRVDPQDKGIVDAALREAQEEIALPPKTVRVIGESDPYYTFTGFNIVPVLGIIPPDLLLTPHEAEVEALFEVPLDFLFSPANRVRRSAEFSGKTHHYYEIFWGEHRIWGITAGIIANLSKRLGYEHNDAD